MLLNLQGIYKSYGGTIEVPVLKNVSIQVAEGEYVAIMGPSGSGKTTLMNIIGCLDRCTEGTYELDGADISRISENELSEVRLKKIGFVFQTFELLPGETAIENVALPLVYAGVPKAEREKAAVEALTKVGLGERVNFKPNQLSGGQNYSTTAFHPYYKENWNRVNTYQYMNFDRYIGMGSDFASSH